MICKVGTSSWIPSKAGSEREFLLLSSNQCPAASRLGFGDDGFAFGADLGEELAGGIAGGIVGGIFGGRVGRRRPF